MPGAFDVLEWFTLLRRERRVCLRLARYWGGLTQGCPPEPLGRVG
jgi:hypothetical protein